MALTSGGRVVPDAPPFTGSVDSQQETTELDGRGLPVRGYRVYFTTSEGHKGSVFLPAAMFTPINVQAALSAQAHVLNQVGRIGS